MLKKRQHIKIKEEAQQKPVVKDWWIVRLLTALNESRTSQQVDKLNVQLEKTSATFGRYFKVLGWGCLFLLPSIFMLFFPKLSLLDALLSGLYPSAAITVAKILKKVI